jgi:hypothetical protein
VLLKLMTEQIKIIAAAGKNNFRSMPTWLHRSFHMFGSMGKCDGVPQLIGGVNILASSSAIK